MKTEFVKPKEKILEDLADPIREAVLSAITPIISNAMTMYSDQQNKELREENQKQKEVIAWADEELARLKSGKESQMMAEIQRLTKEVEELKRGMQKLPFDTVADYELCKKAYQSSSEHAEGFAIKLAKADAELTRLRELLGETKNELHGCLDSLFNLQAGEASVIIAKLLTEIDNALNHKP